MPDEAVARSASLLAALQPHLVGLKKYESNFSPEARELLQRTLKAADAYKSSVDEWAACGGPGLAAYLLSGGKFEDLQTGLTGIQQSLSSLLAGSIPLPRSAKEELSSLRTDLQAIKINASSEQPQVVANLRKLYAEVTDKEKEHDVDLIEANLDEVIKKAIQSVFGSTILPDEDLKVELNSLEQGVEASKAGGRASDAAVLSLALNSMQRLYANQLNLDESEEESEEELGPSPLEDEDDDDEDPFFMPVGPAIKMADASKFLSLAQPLAPAKAEPFILQIKPENPGSPSASGMGGGRVSFPGEEESPILTAQDFEPLPAEAQLSPGAKKEVDRHSPYIAVSGAAVLAAAATAATTAAVIGGTAGESADAAVAAAAAVTNGDFAAQAGSSTADADANATPARTATDEADATPEASKAVDPPGAATAAASAATTTTDHKSLTVQTNVAAGPPITRPDGTLASPGEEKLSQFVNFLQGENPGACMFHAQMRLSVDGCRKLSNFLKSSMRVRALSLSHNYLGDDGLAIICEGLRINTSVTALDLPDNNISDVGIATLTKAIAHNPSLTQLQLAYNRVGDQGAAALAELIKTSSSLKKLGLSYNNIGKAGCQALTSAILSNQSLKHLQLLPGNPVEEKDAKALAKALKHNKKFSIRSFLGME